MLTTLENSRLNSNLSSNTKLVFLFFHKSLCTTHKFILCLLMKAHRLIKLIDTVENSLLTETTYSH